MRYMGAYPAVGAYLGVQFTVVVTTFLNYRVYANRMQAKKIISNLVCAQLESQQFQEVNFLALIRCCVVIEQ